MKDFSQKKRSNDTGMKSKIKNHGSIFNHANLFLFLKYYWIIKSLHFNLLDINTAIESIKTTYKYQTLLKIDLPPTFINYTLEHINSDYGRLLNSNKVYSRHFPTNLEIRQGWPTSPIIFIICAKTPPRQTFTICDESTGYTNACHSTKSATATIQHQILAFADDIITFNYNFEDTITIFKIFGHIMGLEFLLVAPQVLRTSFL